MNQQEPPRSSNSGGFLFDWSKSGCLRWSLKLIMRLTRQIKKHPLAECLFIRSSKRLRLHTTDVIITESSSERKFFFSCTIPTLFRSVPDLPLPAPSQGEKEEESLRAFLKKSDHPARLTKAGVSFSRLEAFRFGCHIPPVKLPGCLSCSCTG